MSPTKIKLNSCFKTSYISKWFHSQLSSFYFNLFTTIKYVIWDFYCGVYAVSVCLSRSVQSRTCIARLKCDGTRAETRFRLSPKRMSPFKLAGASVQSTAGSRGVHICGSNAGYTTFRGSVRVLATHSIRQFPLHFPSRCVTVCHQVSNALYQHWRQICLSLSSG